jgi:cysteine desulfuration protein SufE
MSDIQKRSDALAEDFALIDDWEQRYAYIIDLGRNLDPMPEGLKTDDRLVPGCTSRVWLDMEWKKANGHSVLSMRADSDAHIVKGLVAIVARLFNEASAQEIAAFDMEKSFAEFGFSDNLSPNRRNGFFSMVQTIKLSAAAQ